MFSYLGVFVALPPCESVCDLVKWSRQTHLCCCLLSGEGEGGERDRMTNQTCAERRACIHKKGWTEGGWTAGHGREEDGRRKRGKV